MTASSPTFTGIIGSRLVGTDPFSPRSWSGISPFFFGAARRAGLLRRAFGADVSRIDQILHLASNMQLRKSVWRQHYYLDPSYRRALTRAVARSIQPEDFEGGFLQIGGLFDTPSIANGRTWCASYHDGNIMMRLRSPIGIAGLSRHRVDQAIQYEGDLYRRLDHIFTMSEYLRRSFIEDFSLSPGKVSCIGAGVNLESLPGPNPAKNYQTRTILFIGVEFARKGGHHLLNAFRAVRDRFPDARLHLVGPRTSVGPLPDGVEFHGFLDKATAAGRDALQRLFAESSLFVLPSLYEPFGIAPAEAMLHGIPAIVTGDWALGETVIDGQTGWHLPRGYSETELADVLLEAIADASERQRRGQQAHEHASRNFLWGTVAQKLGRHLLNMPAS